MYGLDEGVVDGPASERMVAGIDSDSVWLEESMDKDTVSTKASG